MGHVLFKVNVSTVIRRDGAFLLIKRADDEEVFPGLWGIPGGTVEPTDSSLEDALRRECLEEVGISIDNIRPITNDIHDKGEKGALYVVYEASYVSGDIKPLDGTADVQWLTIDQIRELDLTPKTLETIEKCL